ncbi:MAG: hypothetical protein HOP29_11680 [Phycisphaerales bacterium]|nr:hypothetical protein [Phycisphaerales bacterium]
MTPNPPHAVPVPPAVTRRHSQVVRGRLARRLAAFVGAAVVLCAVVVWQRDARHIEAARAEMGALLKPLQQYLDEHAGLPAAYPDEPGTVSPIDTGAFRYADADVIRWAKTAGRPVVIAHGRSQGLIARPNGYAVIVYDRGTLRVDWMPGSRLGPSLDEQRSLATAGQAADSR